MLGNPETVVAVHKEGKPAERHMPPTQLHRFIAGAEIYTGWQITKTAKIADHEVKCQ